MSVLITSAVFEHSKALFGDLLVLLAIAYYADDDGKAWPSVKTIAERVRLSERQVQYSIAALVKAGELSVDHRQGPRGCNLFTVTVKPASGVQSTSPQVQSTSGCNGVQGEVHFANGVKPTAPPPRPSPFSPPDPLLIPNPPLLATVRKIVSTPHNPPKGRNGPSEEFLEFWRAYPRKQAMKPAWNAWQKIRSPAPVAEIMEAIALQSRKLWRHSEKRHIPLAATWLNAERWDDEL